MSNNHPRNERSRLVLFDIDGTLLRTNRAGILAIKEAMISVYGTAGSIDTFNSGGKSYRKILDGTLADAGLSPDVIQQQWKRFNDKVVKNLNRIVDQNPGRIYALPGAVELVETLSQMPDILVGLVTGNPSEASWIKLRSAGYDTSMFKVAAFGDEAETRAGQVTLARERAREISGRDFPDRKTIVIGDTTHDIACARDTGARSLIVTTGDSRTEDLMAGQPDVLFKDLSDTGMILEAILDPID